MEQKFKSPYVGSNVNEVIKTVLNFLFFYKILHAQKAPKSTKKH